MEQRNSVRACSIISDTGDARWEQIMRNFSQYHKLETKADFLEMPRVQRGPKQFPTHSSYHGSWNVLGLSGYGVYVFPYGVEYRGFFEDGLFHGEGQLVYQNGTYIKGIFRNGELVERTLVFVDGLEYDERKWSYCEMPDRRYTAEIDDGLQPAGKSYITSTKPSKQIGEGRYDTGDGFYNPNTGIIYKYADPTADHRAPIHEEKEWIMKNCRSTIAPHKPCKELYEEWLEPKLELERNVPSAMKTDKTYKEELENMGMDYNMAELRFRRRSTRKKSVLYKCDYVDNTSLID